MIKAKEAVAVSWATIREDQAKAKYANVRRLRDKLQRNDGILDKQKIQAALRKRQQKQRMWGMAGKVMIGVSLTVRAVTWEKMPPKPCDRPVCYGQSRLFGPIRGETDHSDMGWPMHTY